MSNHSDNPKHIGSDRNSNSDKDKKKESGVSRYLIAYVIALIAIDAVALIAWAWLFYYIAALLLFILFADVLSSVEYVKGKWSETSVTFLVWQGVTFLMAGIFFALDINPINTWWDVTWPGLVSFLLFLLVSIVVLYRQSKDTDAMPKNRATRAEALVGVSVVVAAFMGAVSHLLSVLNPPEEATEIARWLSNDGLPIAFVFYFLTGIGIAGLTVYHTTCNAKVPERYKGRAQRQSSRTTSGPIEALIEQFEIVLDVVISVLDFIVRGIIVWLVRYIVNWLRQLPSEFLMTLKVVLGEVVKFIRSALLQLPLHALAAYCVWGIAVFFRGYVYDESNTVYVFLAASALNIAGIAFCFLVGVPLTLGRYVRSDYVPILRELAENLADVIPHALFVFVGACWSLIGLTHFFGVGNFSRGPLTGLSSGILLFAILVVWLRRQVNKRVST